MSYQKDDLIRYRLNKAQTTLQEAKSLADNGYWNGAVNRLYFSCFYAVIPLLAKSDISARTHNMIRFSFSFASVNVGI
jgi:uncharacterized protein (UPF0332 family)